MADRGPERGSPAREPLGAEPLAAEPPPPQPPAPASPDRPSGRGLSFGWLGGIAIGVAVLVIVYAVAVMTAWLPPLRDFVEHVPVAIAVLVVGTIAVLAVVGRGAMRR